ncbi:MAG: hypothetical protein OXC46_03880 [Thaumarchaeota archaeon]|nr:hypothetical protein [Nitrososphaerota archaeon]
MMERNITITITIVILAGLGIIFIISGTNMEELSDTNAVTKDESIGIISWSADILPKVQHEEIILSGVAEGFEIWEKNNPTLDFDMVSGPADIVVKWEIEPSPHKVGMAQYTTNSIEGTITIHLGRYDCNGNYIQWGKDAVTNTTMHEIGHILQLAHHKDANHLMYGNDMLTQEVFDDLGYYIPDMIGKQDYLVGEKHLRDEIDRLTEQISEYTKEYADIIEQGDLAINDYEIGRLPTDSDYFDMKIIPIVDQYNALVYEYNGLVSIVRCFYNES